MTERVSATVSREAAGLAGAAWAFLALHSGSVSGSPAAIASVLTTFRELYTDTRPALVDALAALRIISAEQANATLPRSLAPSATVTRADLTALTISIYPMAELGRLNSAARVPSSYQGASPATTDAPIFGTAEDLRAIFNAAPAGEAGLRAWFARLTTVWPRSSSDSYARQLWWFANAASSAAASGAGPALERSFTDYVFTGGDAGAVRSSAQQQAAMVTSATPSAIPTGASVTTPPLPPPVELDPTTITARASGRSPWFYFVIAFGIFGLGGLSWFVWQYRQRNAKPWKKR